MNSEQLIIRLAPRYYARVLPLSATVKTYSLSQVNQNLDDLRSANIQGCGSFWSQIRSWKYFIQQF